jgi:hypothetical protein
MVSEIAACSFILLLLQVGLAIALNAEEGRRRDQTRRRWPQGDLTLSVIL